ncbi:hypothetical protein FQA39_LY03568 [Lamprigera yunnana]|nr:hypothetical protein FQA39_LY03568 [Lamprigera yunnana]
MALKAAKHDDVKKNTSNDYANKEAYSQARLNLKKAEDTSNLDTDEDMSSERRRKRKIQVLPGESEDDDDDIVKTKWKKSYQIKQSIPEYPNFQCSITTTMKRVLVNTDRILLGQMQTTIAAVAEQIVRLNNKMDALLNSSQNCYNTNSASEFSLLGHLPLQTIEDFDSFEQKLQEDNFCNKVIQVLVSVGQNDLRNCVANMMCRLMSDSLGEMFSYSGKKINDTKKLPFGKHKLCRSVHSMRYLIYNLLCIEPWCFITIFTIYHLMNFDMFL